MQQPGSLDTVLFVLILFRKTWLTQSWRASLATTMLHYKLWVFSNSFCVFMQNKIRNITWLFSHLCKAKPALARSIPALLSEMQHSHTLLITTAFPFYHSPSSPSPLKCFKENVSASFGQFHCRIRQPAASVYNVTDQSMNSIWVFSLAFKASCTHPIIHGCASSTHSSMKQLQHVWFTFFSELVGVCVFV